MASRWHWALRAAALLPATGLGLAAAPVLAEQPRPWELGLQPAATPVMESLIGFHDFLLVIISLITLLVMVLLGIVIFRFNERKNPIPSRTSHNTTIEVLWTVLPVIILVVIAIPSFRLLYFQMESPEPEVTIKATGYQWYWSYEYPDEDGLLFDSYMLQDDELQEGQPRLLAVDNEVVVPVGRVVKMLVTADPLGVIHAWTIPAFGSKVDAVPGRMNETWFRVDRPGVYYGQCSELCGRDHAFMPIAVRAVSDEDYAAWLEQARAEFANKGGSSTTLAQAN